VSPRNGFLFHAALRFFESVGVLVRFDHGATALVRSAPLLHLILQLLERNFCYFHARHLAAQSIGS